MTYSEPNVWSVSWSECDAPLHWRGLELIVPALGFSLALWSIWSELGSVMALFFTAAVAGVMLVVGLLGRSVGSRVLDGADGQWHICPEGLVYRASGLGHDQSFEIERVVRHLGGMVVWLKGGMASVNGEQSVRIRVWRGSMSFDVYRRLSILLRWHSGGRA